MIILNSSRLSFENSFRKTWILAELQCDSTNSKWSPVTGEYVLNSQVALNICWILHIGLPLFVVKSFPFAVKDTREDSKWVRYGIGN